MLDHLLVPFSTSAGIDYVLSHALGLAQLLKAHVTLLRLLGSVQGEGASHSVDPLDWQLKKTEADSQLEKAGERLQSAGIEVEKVLLEGVGSIDQIIKYAHQHEVSLILLPNTGSSGSEEISNVILHTSIPSLIIPSVEGGTPPAIRYKKLLVPLDGSQRAECVLPIATTLRQALDAELVMAHVVRKPEMPRRAPLTGEDVELVERITDRNREEAERYLEQVSSRLAPDVQMRLLISDNPAATLHKLVDVEAIDLVILSAHGYSGAPTWPYGSITNTFLAYSTKPVLVVQDLPVAIEKSAEGDVAPRESGVR